METVSTQRQQLQQHVQVSRKRRSEQGDDGCSEKSKKPKEKTETTQVDLKDGANISIQVEQLLSQRTQEYLPCCVQSLLRSQRYVRPGEPGGNLLKAGNNRTPKTINVEFTGTNTEDPATEFSKEMCDVKKACALRYSEGDDDYYLKVKKSGDVNLRKLVDFPTDDKYFFTLIERIDTNAVAIQSLKTKELYLHCSDLGKVFMKKVTTGDNGAPEDVQTWFKLMRKEHVVQYQKMSMMYSRNDSGVEFDIFEETTLDVKDSGKDDPGNTEEENSEEGRKENAENPEVGNSDCPAEGNYCSDAGSDKSQGATEATPKSQKGEHSEEL